MIMRLGLLVVVINRIVYIESAMYPHGTAWSHWKAYKPLMLCYKEVSKKNSLYPENPMHRYSNGYTDINIDNYFSSRGSCQFKYLRKEKSCSIDL